MSKEAIVAIIVGLFIGAVVGFGVWRANSFLDDNSQQSSSAQDSKTLTENASVQKNGITLLSPEEYDVIGANTVNIKGMTKPDSVVVISGETEDAVISTENGEFEGQIDLEEGLNWIIIKSISFEDIQQKELKVVYSTKFSND